MVAYFLVFLLNMCTALFRPHQMRGLIAFKAITMPFALFGLFIWCLVRSGGPGGLELTAGSAKGSTLAWTFLAAINAAINGEFGPLIASNCKYLFLDVIFLANTYTADISRYAKTPKSQFLGQALVAPWSASVVVCFGIIAAACTQKIYGEAYWNPGLIMYQILAEHDSSATRFACFLCSFVMMVGCVGTNYVANLLPFGVDCSGFAPRYLNITRSQILCELIGAWVVVPWKVLTSGASFLVAITGLGIFVACLLGIMVSDYYFVRNGNYWIEDLYTDDPNGRYWYKSGFHWRAYAAYICGIVVPFPGFVGAIGGGKLSLITNGAAQIYAIGYLLSFCIGGLVYYVLCKISPPGNVAEARSIPFETMGQREVLIGLGRPLSHGQDSEDLAVEIPDLDRKGVTKADM